ncbi:uncharacterized protein LOC119393043 [Rhipicephalus sanguineus]|uniref:uncharacterized protein LOC119393043 n=1 Tax=Rhipicephalus sanguineus TaxID=34632 RepID=UPI00189344B7|nr:uncharacterized protein LOC119393043 [Rhipicephalus sanguineus]
MIPLAKRVPVGVERWRRLSDARLAPIPLRTVVYEGDDDDGSELPIKPYMKVIPAAVIVFLVVSSTIAVAVFATLQNGAPTRQSAARSPRAESDSRFATDLILPLLTPEANEEHLTPVNVSIDGSRSGSIGGEDPEPWGEK